MALLEGTDVERGSLAPAENVPPQMAQSAGHRHCQTRGAVWAFFDVSPSVKTAEGWRL